MQEIRLTPQQQAVVNHTYGPALVFAVAGAGKTTALEHRIVRLVQTGIFAPERILAAAYNTAVKEELGKRLRRHAGCAPVEVMTLHALGLRAVRMAWDAGLLPHLARTAFAETEHAQDAILLATLVEARKQKVAYVRELDGMDRTDFLTWLSDCKGNLLYPSLDALPAVLRQSGLAQQATPPPQTEWYLPFAQLMEVVQHAQGLLTFDDQLRMGWEVLISHKHILARLQQRYDCVLVDEFQDVNLAQYQILDMLTAPHRNYMVVGDDDQTIYEWRGANPHFILNFGKAYKATQYLMSENFRCPAGPLTLANAVIRHNQQRHPKMLGLTQGFGGTTMITRSAGRRQMGQAIVQMIRTLHAQGDRLQEMAVLVRAKAQTPPVELALIQAQIPYEVVGSQPFYARWEVTTLIAYCRLALLEAQLQRGKQLTAPEAAQLVESWETVYRHPKRYISASDAQQIGTELARGRHPITSVLRGVVIADKPHVQTRLGELATLLQWLSGAFVGGNDKRKDKHKDTRNSSDNSAHARLLELEKKLGYCAYLEQRGTLSETGVDEAENVRQFIEEAKDRGTLLDYLVYLKELAVQQASQQAAARGNLITIRTIHSAKGLEWQVVILPSCDEHNIPHRKSANLQEERRLLYVALTRSRRDLYIYHLAAQPSPFLAQAQWATVLNAVAQIRGALGKPPALWSKDELAAMAVALPNLGLLDYFHTWHPWAAGEQAAILAAAQAYFADARNWGRQRLEGVVATWQQWAQSVGVPFGEVDAARHAPTAPPQSLRITPPIAPPVPYSPARPMRAPAAPPVASPVASPVTSRRDSMWQTFDEVQHPRYGRGIIISTTTTTRRRELKVQFVDGNLMHFGDDDPALVRG